MADADAHEEPLEDEDALTDEEVFELHVQIGEAFSPGTPINTRDLFAGRQAELSKVLSVVGRRGRHVVIYGERGVGKTSLASIVGVLVLTAKRVSARVNCDGSDDFDSVWRKMFSEIAIVEERPGTGFEADVEQAVEAAEERLPSENAGPNDVRAVLEQIAQAAEPVVIIDEFDRVRDPTVRAVFADTIKTLSDHGVRATVILVGVADDVDDLIAAHASVERALSQVQMPRMSRGELEEVVNRGLKVLDMTIKPQALQRLTRLSQGLPHYTHLLAQQAALRTVNDRRREIDLADLEGAISEAIKDVERSIRDAYHRATASARETLYPQVLLACALAQGDDLGYFAPADVREPLSAVMGKSYDIPAFIQHLHALSESDRGPVLHKRGAPHRYRFRFLNPLLQPYVIMRGLDEGLLTRELLDRH